MSEPTAAKAERDRTTEEPRGRWENRCPYVWTIVEGARLLICDRPIEHRGLHRGRILLIRGDVGLGEPTRVIAYGAHR